QPTSAENLKKRLDDQNDILEIEGNQYVKNEVLEEKEFNLDGKKRFYTMPEGIIDTKNGATRLQTVQREKGIGQSVMQALFKKNRATGQDTPLILAVTYYRISAETASEGMGRTCFQDKKLKKAKDIALDTQVNLWPRAPLKDEFDFEVVKLKQPLQNIQIQSYASRQKDPTFYWPFAVFLDEKGCILEGAGGFKNNDSASDYLKYENIEGMIQVPRNSHYLLLTPLASAIDVEERVLSNQGQLKLIGVR
ncbi:putative pilus assembly protein FilE, partial [Acinetobacter sp. UBA3132]